jgi:predicted ABC-type ATPase
MNKGKPALLILGGPNGAGKTTCAMTLLPEFLHINHFVNADLIAQGLSPFDPALAEIQASRIMVERMRELRNTRENFAIETTLASKSPAKFITESKTAGYEISLIFVTLDSPETAIARVALRVAKGGHHIPEETIRRRYFRGIANLFERYMPLADQWTIMDNSETEKRMIAKAFSPEYRGIYYPEIFSQLERKAYNACQTD